MIHLHFQQYGEPENPPLVILHGFLGSSDNWHTLSKDFAKHFSVWAIDQRNHGKSEHTYEFDYELLVDDLYEFFDQNKIEKPIVMGHSMGGKVAMQFALTFPNLLSKLIVADMSPFQYPAHHQVVLEAIKSVPLEKIQNRKEAEQILAQYLPENDTRQFIMKNLVFRETRYTWRFNAESLIDNYENILKPVAAGKPFQKPTLFLKGSRSNYLKTENWNEILNLFPKAILATIEGAGHWLHAEKPKEFYQEVMKFLL